MALVKCRECGHGVSTQSSSCPHCGAPTKSKSQGGWGAPFLAFAIIVAVGWYFLAPTGSLNRRAKSILTTTDTDTGTSKSSLSRSSSADDSTAAGTFKARTASLRRDKWIRDWAKIAQCDIKRVEGSDEIEGIVYLTHFQEAYIAEFTYRYSGSNWKPFKTSSKAGFLINTQVEGIMTGRSQPEPGSF